MQGAKFKNKLTYRQVLDHYGMILCESHLTCKRRWSRQRHLVGAADGMGHIHWSRANSKVTRRGLRSLLVVIAGVTLKHDTSKVPKYQKLYEANVWAWEEGIKTWKVQFTQEMSKTDRLRAKRLARNDKIRSTNMALYQWMRGRKKEWGRTHSSTSASSTK